MKANFFGLRFKFKNLLLLGFLLVVVGFHSCFTFRMNEKKVLKKLSQAGFKPEFGRKNGLNYVEVGNKEAQMVVFVHGAPGSLADFVSLMSDSVLQREFRMLALDRPGYGRSDPGKSMVSVSEQSESISAIFSLNTHASQPILVGHSYGATIAARMAMDFPELIGALVLAAGGYDPKHERKFWINPVIDHWSVKWMVPWAFRVSNDEKLAHPAELEAMNLQWHKIKIPVTLIHGKPDWIVPFANSVFAQKMLVNSPQLDTVFLDNLSHLIPWQAPHLIKEAILKYKVNP
jgi:pimeloyl-ACP methyl ester carboxylesterase